MALAAFRSAIFNRLLPLGTLLESTFPPLTLLFGASLSQEQSISWEIYGAVQVLYAGEWYGNHGRAT